uniref:RRM domain-containing protein n=1 Tax=Aegilops tauschii TaxID=37682 RepID=R7W4L5_AEGTA
MRRSRWSDLPVDLLREIAGRLHVAVDLVRFHAVCKPWRSSRDLLSQTTATHLFLPWILAPVVSDSPLKLRCVFSKSGYCAPPTVPLRDWVCSADATALWHHPVVTSHLRPSYYTYLSRSPLIQWEEGRPSGIVYGDGTTFVYSISRVKYLHDTMTRFSAALFCPGDTEWTLVERTLETPWPWSWWSGEFCAAYHGGKILLTVKAKLWHAITPNSNVACDVVVPRLLMPDEHDSYSELSNYVLESRGELLWVSVQIWSRFTYKLAFGSRRFQQFSVSVHAPVGSPISFAVDASLMGGHGGCAYFASTRPDEQYGVFRYSLIDGKTKLVEQLPLGWHNDKCTWVVPRPTIAPIQEIIKGSKLKAPKLQHHQTAPVVTSRIHINHIQRHYEPSFRVLVRNLPITVKDSQLRHFFSKHGKVLSAEEKGEKSVDRLVRALSMLVQTLKEVADGPEKLLWVSKDGWSLEDHVLFLG